MSFAQKKTETTPGIRPARLVTQVEIDRIQKYLQLQLRFGMAKTKEEKLQCLDGIEITLKEIGEIEEPALSQRELRVLFLRCTRSIRDAEPDIEKHLPKPMEMLAKARQSDDNGVVDDIINEVLKLRKCKIETVQAVDQDAPPAQNVAQLSQALTDRAVLRRQILAAKQNIAKFKRETIDAMALLADLKSNQLCFSRSDSGSEKRADQLQRLEKSSRQSKERLEKEQTALASLRERERECLRRMTALTQSAAELRRDEFGNVCEQNQREAAHDPMTGLEAAREEFAPYARRGSVEHQLVASE